jgi:hypothetical protein
MKRLPRERDGTGVHVEWMWSPGYSSHPAASLADRLSDAAVPGGAVGGEETVIVLQHHCAEAGAINRVGEIFRGQYGPSCRLGLVQSGATSLEFFENIASRGCLDERFGVCIVSG